MDALDIGNIHWPTVIAAALLALVILWIVRRVF